MYIGFAQCAMGWLIWRREWFALLGQSMRFDDDAGGRLEVVMIHPFAGPPVRAWRVVGFVSDFDCGLDAFAQRFCLPRHCAAF